MLIFPKLAIKQIVPSDAYGSLLDFGTRFSTKEGYFTLFFQNFRINIKSYTLKVGTDVFPIRWNLSVSNSNSVWTEVSSVNESLCSKENWVIQSSNKYFCSENEEKTFPVNHRGYYNYVRFDLIENSYYVNYEWLKLINIYGFEINGDALSNVISCKTMKKRSYNCINYVCSVILFLIYSK